jgi:hypothetical protein
MNLVHGLNTFVQTVGSGQAILVAWLCILALAAVVLLVLIGLGVHSPGRGRRTGADHRAPFWPHGMPQPPSGPQHQQERYPHERR